MAGDRYALQVLSRFPRFFSLAGDFGINFQMVNPLLAVALVAAVASNYCRVTGVRIVARRGIHLLLRTNVLRAAAWIPACALATIIVLDPHRAVGDFLLRNTGSLLLIGTAAAGLTYRVQLGQWIDRRFFRATYEEEQGLLKLIDEIKAQDSVEAILMLVHGQVEAALCPSRVVRFARQRQTGDMILGYSTAEGGCTLIPRDSELLHALAQCDRPRDFPFTAGELTASGGYWLEQLGITLIVPVTADGCDLHGLILLGEKKSGEPYSAADRKLLQAVAERMAILYEDAAHPAARQVNLMKECPACGCCYDGSNMACAIDGEELTLSVPLPVERVVDGRYQLEWRLRNGTTGAVYSAVDLRLKRPVAVKVMLSSRLGNRAALTRFEREAQAVAALRHPNIIAIYDFGQIGSDGVYVVMELLCGWTWREELKRMGPVSPRKLAGRAGQLLEGVKAAHDAGVVHRDLKPENIMTEPLPAGGELIKVLDFGLAKHHPGSISRPPTAIQPGAVAGTCGYMAPEQWTGAKTDQRSDVFSIGVILVEALTGRHPLLSPRSGLMFNPFLGQRIELSGSGAEVRQLETVLRRCLAAERDERFSSVEKLRSELIPVLAECPPLEPEPSGLT